MKNIWIINEYANTTNDYGGIRHSMLAENLFNYKYNVLIFIGSLIHNTNKNRLGRLEKMRIEYIKDVGYVLIKLNPINASYKINRIFLMLQFFLKLLLINSKNFNQKPDLIIGSSPSPLSALAGYLLSLKFKAKFIYEVRDLWPATLISFKVLKKNNLITFLLYKLEKFLAFRAEKIIVLFKNGANYFRELGVNLEKVIYISNGTNLIKKNINLKKIPIIDYLI